MSETPGTGLATNAVPKPGNWLQSFVRDPSVRAALFAFALTRALILAVFLIVPRIDQTVARSFDTSRNSHVTLNPADIARDLGRTVMVADVNWYVGIAQEGYHRRAFEASTHHNWAFFPGFPILLRAAQTVTEEFPLTGMAISSFCLLLALIALHKCAQAFGLDQAAADRAVFYLAAFPTSYFFSLPVTESLFLFLTVASVLSARHDRWWLAGLLGACASGTRATGVLLLPTLAVLYWQMHGLRRPHFNVLGLAIIPAGLFAFMAHLHAITGNPLAFKDVLAAWGRTTDFFFLPLLDYLRSPLRMAYPWDFTVLNFFAVVAALCSGLLLLKQRSWALGTYVLLSLFVTLSSGLLQSQARYAMVLFPMFFALAWVGQRPILDQTIRAISIALLALMSALFAAHFNIALS